jgi:hypothetical protein
MKKSGWQMQCLNFLGSLELSFLSSSIDVGGLPYSNLIPLAKTISNSPVQFRGKCTGMYLLWMALD